MRSILERLVDVTGKTTAAAWLITLVISMSVGSASLLAQVPTTAVLGTVKDSTGAVMPGVNVTAVNVGTGQTRTAVTADNGSYRIPALPIGTYEVRAELQGFQTAVRMGLALTVGQDVVVNLELQVGAIEQAVSVTADAPLVNTTSGAVVSVTSEQTISELPIKGRNYIDLALLQPGVTQSRYKSDTAPSGGGRWLSVNGAPLRSNYYMLDGAYLGTILGGLTSSSAGNTLGLDGIGEFQMTTSSFSAEYGMTMGSQMMMVSKAGTNAYHGSLFEYNRSSALQARGYFDQSVPHSLRNQFGGSLGGPIVKNHLLFFGNYEGVREVQGGTQITTTIPAAARVDGGLVPQVNPVMKPLLALYPLPNGPNNQYRFSTQRKVHEDYGQGRLDYQISNVDSLFGRYTIDDATTIKPAAYPQFTTADYTNRVLATLSETHGFSPSLLNVVRFSLSHYYLQQTSTSGLIGPDYSFVSGRELGSISAFSGIAAFQPTNDPYVNKMNVWTWSDDIFKTTGRHSLKFGALVNYFQTYNINDSASREAGRGAMIFPDLTSFLLGKPSSYRVLSPGSELGKSINWSTVGFYAQDDLRPGEHLSLNLGVRYEVRTMYKEVSGHGSSLQNLSDAQVAVGSDLFGNSSFHNISPRFGFAWDINGTGKTALRGGAARLYDINGYGNGLTEIGSTPPFAGTTVVNNPAPLTSLPLVVPTGIVASRTLTVLDSHMKQPYMYHFNVALERQLPGKMSVTIGYVGSRGFNLVQVQEGNSAVPQVLTDGQQFWPATAVRRNPNWDSINFKTAAGQSWYDSLQLSVNKRMSGGFQIQSSYTLGRMMDTTQGATSGDSVGSPNISVAPDVPGYDKALSDFNLKHNWWTSAIYHFPTTSSGRVLDAVASGWWLSGIVSLQSGMPFTPVLGTNRSRSLVFTGSGDRPDVAAGRDNGNIASGTTAGCPGVAAGQQLGTPTLYFDPCAYSIPPAGFLGTAGRNSLIGPGNITVDATLARDFDLSVLGENGKAQFRLEVFNLFNRPNFGFPNGTVFTARQNAEPVLAGAGRITSAALPRSVQLGLRIVF